MLDVQIIRHVSEVEPEKWDYLAKGQPFASYRWYQFGESILTDETPFYILLSWEGEPIARATFWLLRREPLPVQTKVVRSVMALAFRRWPLLMCRAPLVDVSGLILPADPALRTAALTTIAQVARELGRQHGVSFTAFDYLNPGEFTLDGFPMIDISGPTTRMAIQWDNFDAYVKQLGSSARKDFNRQRNRAADMNLIVQAHNSVSRIDEALPLIRNVEQEHNSPPNPNVHKILENAHRVDSTWLTAEVDGRLVGCGLVMGDESARFLTCLGLDYDVKYVYFQMAYAAIRCAIEAQVSLLCGGGGAYEFKERLGFELVNNNQIAVASNNAALAQLVRRIAG